MSLTKQEALLAAKAARRWRSNDQEAYYDDNGIIGLVDPKVNKVNEYAMTHG